MPRAGYVCMTAAEVYSTVFTARAGKDASTVLAVSARGKYFVRNRLERK